MPIFDSHCHYNLEPLTNSWEHFHQLALRAGVSHSVIVGTSVATSQLAFEQSQTNTGLFSSCGIHPNEAHDIVALYKDGESYDTSAITTHIQKEVEKLLPLLETKKPVAIGETGLDFYRLKSRGGKRAMVIEAQKQLFVLQLQLAKQFDIPLIVHVRDQDGRVEDTAYTNTFELLKEHGCTRFVLHCVSGPLGYITQAAQLGGYIGIAGNITYSQDTTYLHEILAVIDAKKVLVETDAPYLAPVPYRGQVCEPHMIAKTVEHLESVYSLSAAQLFKNACTFYGIQVQ